MVRENDDSCLIPKRVFVLVLVEWRLDVLTFCFFVTSDLKGKIGVIKNSISERGQLIKLES